MYKRKKHTQSWLFPWIQSNLFYLKFPWIKFPLNSLRCVPNVHIMNIIFCIQSMKFYIIFENEENKQHSLRTLSQSFNLLYCFFRWNRTFFFCFHQSCSSCFVNMTFFFSVVVGDWKKIWRKSKTTFDHLLNTKSKHSFSTNAMCLKYSKILTLKTAEHDEKYKAKISDRKANG